jgi:signal transduction histidine kinase
LPRDMEMVIFRLVQECLTNIHRHSGSKTGRIKVVREPSQVIVEVSDDGKGMSPEQLAEIQTGSAGVGIRGMRERLLQFKGSLKFESTNAGTRVTANIPIPPSAESAKRA